MNLNVPQELLQKIANYLTTKPYGEVYGLLNEMARLWQAEPTEPLTPPSEVEEVVK
jgi:hypothetical protein